MVPGWMYLNGGSRRSVREGQAKRHIKGIREDQEIKLGPVPGNGCHREGGGGQWREEQQRARLGGGGCIQLKGKTTLATLKMY